MPHMANLPWLPLYIIIFITMMLIYSSMYFNQKISNMKTNESNSMKKNMTTKW